MSTPKRTPEERASDYFYGACKAQVKALGMKQSSVAADLGVSNGTFSNNIHNPDKIPVWRLRALVRALELDVETVLLLFYDRETVEKYIREKKNENM